MENTENNINLKKYNLLFAVTYGAGIAFINILSQVFDIDSGSFADNVIMMGCIYFVAGRFFNDEQRLPDKTERKKLVIANLIISTLISLVILLFIILLSPDGEQLWGYILKILVSISIFAWVMIISLVVLFYYFLLTFLYFISGKILMKQKNKDS
ncbi:MAG: ABZJ_00895 family protein [Rickettsiales bacterium]|nr:ABZJ_00895 family protein [Pseudomonadota bacterium]MDA0965944.1 ABZJ_00895 family protein [Pseudomonadota bacterium]MDG4542584.1 ABZJ_00895 family protein [Rickettsiales bacterium]MDG4545088.1 ABZJ_00895 family protein [Rickettsiales bacterium]MDG4547211.1 ABZJ_00895 family protein [Rickettsiales bacterium]